MISNIKIVIIFFLSSIIDLFVSAEKKINKKTILLIRLDAIGDYVLFRNFIKVIKNDSRYGEYKITLLGNIVYQDIIEEIDSESIESYISLDRKKFIKDLKYRYKKLKEITSKGYEIVLSPVYSREFFYADNIVKMVTATNKIGNMGNIANIKKWQKIIADGYYTELYTSSNDVLFEFYRNKEFFENFLEKKIDMEKPLINLVEKKIDFELPSRYVVMFIGANFSFRKWNIESFAKVARYLKTEQHYNIVLCGALEDTEDAIAFSKYYKDEYLDLVGKTSLIDLFHVVKNSKIIVSNETLAPHIAVMLNVPYVFVIYNGHHYGRFLPYPKEITENHHIIYHPKIEENLEEYKIISNNYGFNSILDMNEISFESVKNKIDKVLK